MTFPRWFTLWLALATRHEHDERAERELDEVPAFVERRHRQAELDADRAEQMGRDL